MTAPPVLDLRAMTDDDEDEVLQLLTLTMAGGPTGARSRELFAWKHRRNPFGSSPGLLAVHDGRIVGVRLFLRWRLASARGPLRAVRAVDTATHPDYQRQGIFRRLTLTLLEQLEADDAVDLVFNTPNADSRPGYLRMGWQEAGLLPVHISPVRPVTFLRGLRGARNANASGGAAAVAGAPTVPVPASACPLPRAAEAFADAGALDHLLAGIRTPAALHTPRTVDYLRWRYAEAPGLDYRCVPVHDAGRLVGLGLGRLRRRAGLVELTLGEVLVRDGDVRAAGRVLRAARTCGVDHVAVHAGPGSEVAARLLRCGYLPVPGQGIGLVVNPRTPPAGRALDPDAWAVSLGDLEVF